VAEGSPARRCRLPPRRNLFPVASPARQRGSASETGKKQSRTSENHARSPSRPPPSLPSAFRPLHPVSIPPSSSSSHLLPCSPRPGHSPPPPHHRHHPPASVTMGYIDDEVKRLQGIIDNLDGRVKALELRQTGDAPRPKTVEELRMILIGPPGAGTSSSAPEPPPRTGCWLLAARVALSPSSVQPWHPASGQRPAPCTITSSRQLTKTFAHHRQGHPGPQAQGEVQLLPPGKPIGPGTPRLSRL